MSAAKVVALDIGGANIKIADGRGYAASRPFPLWREPQRLAAILREELSAAPVAARVVATMTGELADCFRTKAEGVSAIVTALMEAAGGQPVSIYLTDGSFVAPQQAHKRPLEAASSNWHALARFAARWLPGGSGLLLDIGSTTCDLIPIQQGQPAAHGRTDPERLAAGELLYTGVTRSPVCAVVAILPWRGSKSCPVAQELFATTLDAYVTLGELPEQTENCQTADGRPATREFARDRLARMICADREMFDERDATLAAQAIRSAQVRRIATSLKTVRKEMRQPLESIVLSGSGEFLAHLVLKEIGFEGEIQSLSQILGAHISQAAPAHALAVLAAELES